MVLTIDIGNTNIVLGGFIDEELTFIARMATNTKKTEFEYAVKIREIMVLRGIEEKSIDGAIISSVVPQLTENIKRAVKIIYNISPLVVGPGIKTGINLLVDNPAEVGADLICACVAGYNLYKSPVLITDMGTATKMMVVDENAAFRGVSIIPGVEISLKALAGTAAQLPHIGLSAPQKVIAKNTEECMRSGIIYGNASLVDGMIDRILDEIGKKATLLATGGLSSMIIPHCRHEIKIDENLILKGLYIIYKKNSQLN